MSNSDKFALLLALAATQGGYFTAQQAKTAGYGYGHQHYQVTQGHWLRVAHGLYRLSGYPEPPDFDLIELTLHSADRAGHPQLVFSHETALRLHELGEGNPVHLTATVPPGFRKRLPPGVRVHRAQLAAWEWEERTGYRVTTPLRTLLDVAAQGESQPDIVDQAVRDALERGLVRRRELEQAEGTTRMKARLRATLRRLGQEPPTRQMGAFCDGAHLCDGQCLPRRPRRSPESPDAGAEPGYSPLAQSGGL